MPTTLIIGGSGRVARQLTRLLAHPPHSHTVHSIIRNAAQKSEIQELGGQPIVDSIEDATTSSFAETIKRTAPDYIVWTAGAGGKGGPERTNAVDHEGAVKAFDAASQAGVKRFIMVSAVDVRSDKKPEPNWYNDDDKARSKKMWEVLNAYMHAKLKADIDLRTKNDQRGLQYTIVRPGTLLDDEGTGKVNAGRVHLTGISREDVAKVIIACIENEGTVGLAFDVVGGETPIEEAVKKVAESKEDSFEGMY